MRIVIALLTLQREVVKISEACSRLYWLFALLRRARGDWGSNWTELTLHLKHTPEWACHDSLESVAIVSSWLSHLGSTGGKRFESGEHELFGRAGIIRTCVADISRTSWRCIHILFCMIHNQRLHDVDTGSIYRTLCSVYSKSCSKMSLYS